MEEVRLKEVIKALSEAGVNNPCPRCTNIHFEVIGESMISIQEDPSTLVVGGPAVPVVLVACNKCGFITQHALGPLKLTRGQK